MSQTGFLVIMTCFGTVGLVFLLLAIGLYRAEMKQRQPRAPRRKSAPQFFAAPTLVIPPRPPHAAPSRLSLPGGFDPRRN